VLSSVPGCSRFVPGCSRHMRTTGNTLFLGKDLVVPGVPGVPGEKVQGPATSRGVACVPCKDQQGKLRCPVVACAASPRVHRSMCPKRIGGRAVRAEVGRTDASSDRRRPLEPHSATTRVPPWRQRPGWRALHSFPRGRENGTEAVPYRTRCSTWGRLRSCLSRQPPVQWHGRGVGVRQIR
jgi:hypothetical protein